MRKIFTIHGIRTDNEWPNTFKNLVGNRPNVEVKNFEYGYFTLTQFLSRWHRNRAIKAFERFYSENVLDGELPSVVCHSFGTFIFFSAIRKYKSIKFDKVILCGSILSTKLNWKQFFDSDQIRILYNDYSALDSIVPLSRLVVRNCGRSGRVGFKKIPKDLENKIIQRDYNFEHSDYFFPPQMKNYWLKVLLSERKLIKYSQNILRPEVIERIYQNIQYDPLEFEKVEFWARIDETGNYHARYTRHCKNISSSSVDQYSYNTSADSIEDADDMGFIAYDEAGKILDCHIGNDALQKKTCVIRLNNPVSPQAKFLLTYLFKWKNTITFKRGDTDHFEIKTAKAVYIAVNFRKTLINPRFLIVNDHEVIEEKQVKRKKEQDGTVSYYLDYNNENNYDGIVFYFEGANPEKNLPMTKEIKILKKVNGVNFFNCSLSDIKQVYRIEAEIEYSNAASENTLIERQAMFGDGFIVAKEKSRIVGYIETVIWNKFEFEKFDDIRNFPQFYQPTGDTLYVIFIGVDKDYRRRGIGECLLEAVEKVALKYNVNRIQLVAKEGLVTFYGKFGYSVVKELLDFLPDRDYKSTLMEKSINKGSDVTSTSVKEDNGSILMMQ